ncbi:hypothetical protein HEK616_27260 [Streptomyces nigrescens]|uniref:PPM-type phosphatase domain-containing protein n=1 Tax=Streptomyces nigrescens TaxID=1920 RepID=A0ABN6QST1_STRNI|nr:hypothetical protein HEK616_27260 [Streptomyces nigrescens]
MVHFWRTGERAPFEGDDRSAAMELVARAALCIDNARRYTREHATAVALQRSLLPSDLPRPDAVQVAHRYLPARAGVGGDWFDVIPLAGERVALVVGDVVGHGLHAAATMGRLRTAIHNFAGLDMPPDELLSHLDELVDRIDRDESTDTEAITVTGATVLYAIYDSVSGQCTMARAGHPPPALVFPDGTVTIPDVPAGPPLGLTQLPFESSEHHLPEGTRIVLYTDGLIRSRDRSLDTGLTLLRRALAGAADRNVDEICEDACRTLLPAEQEDDIVLLVARTRRLPAAQVAHWDVPHEPFAVAPVRTAVSAKLAEWGLEETAFTTELVLSELVTNAIRYGTPPVAVRLLLDRTLTCEVSDGSSTAPALRRHHGRRRPRPVPGRPPRRSLGHPLHPRGKDHLDRAAPQVRSRRAGARSLVASGRAQWLQASGTGLTMLVCVLNAPDRPACGQWYPRCRRTHGARVSAVDARSRFASWNGAHQ